MKVLVVALIVSLGAAAPALAASPAVSRGEVLVPIGFDECIARARAAFPAEGFAVEPYTDGNFVFAHKAIHSAYITCSPAPEGKMWVNIFVASYTQDGKVPGAERSRLQDRMGRMAPVQDFTGTWSTTKDWRSITLEQRGTQVTGRYANPPGSITGTVFGDTLVLQFKNDAGPHSGRAYMRLTSPTSFEGRWCFYECDPKIATTTFSGTKP